MILFTICFDDRMVEYEWLVDPSAFFQIGKISSKRLGVEFGYAFGTN